MRNHTRKTRATSHSFSPAARYASALPAASSGSFSHQPRNAAPYAHAAPVLPRRRVLTYFAAIPVGYRLPARGMHGHLLAARFVDVFRNRADFDTHGRLVSAEYAQAQEDRACISTRECEIPNLPGGSTACFRPA
jgi:hypothetical protein